VEVEVDELVEGSELGPEEEVEEDEAETSPAAC
jgi:hypothetical protein